MKTIVITLIGVLPLNLLYSQTLNLDLTSRIAVEITPPTPQQRYKLDYQLKDESLLLQDSTILNMLDLEVIDTLRLPLDDVLHTDVATNQELIIYSEKKVLDRKRKIDAFQNFKQ